mgnify:CR=1 FL=1
MVSDGHALVEAARQQRQYGWGEQRISQLVGINSRLDELQAAILVEKLAFLDQDNARRREMGPQYDAALDTTDIQIPERRDGVFLLFHQYAIHSVSRKTLGEFLPDLQLGPSIHYPLE